MKIFCINLERASERRNRIENLWINKLELNIDFWKAYDRRLINKGISEYLYNREKSKKIFGRFLSNGEIACVTSYYKLFEYCYKENLEEFIIMEDDVVPLIEDKEEIFNSIKNAKEEFPSGMILMHQLAEWQPSDESSIAEPLEKAKNNIYYKKSKFSSLCRLCPWGNLMFYITKKAVQTILNEPKEIWFPADYFQQYLLCPKNLVSILNKPICKHDSENLATYIGNDMRSGNVNFIK
jgi:GR25 family glycosyltransferase involved in LPS biosynthesis